MLTFLRRFFNNLFSPQPHRDMDTILALFNSPRCTLDTSCMLNQLIQSILLTTATIVDLNSTVDPPELEGILNRFMVKTITLNKHTNSSQHEYLTFEIMDTQDDLGRAYLIFLERTTSDIPRDSDYFTEHPDSSIILSNIMKIFEPSGDDYPPAPNNMRDDDIAPLFHSTPPSNTSVVSQVMDAASLASAQACYRSAEILAKTKTVCANDQFLLGQQSRLTHGRGRIIRQLQPDALSLFDLIILANTVHDHDPLYSLLKRQCYWFANVIYLVVSSTYNCRHDVIQAGDDEQDHIRIPLNTYLPDKAGRWMGVLVSKVSETVIPVMKEKFEACRAKELTKVFFFKD